jgi:hypothetical protein
MNLLRREEEGQIWKGIEKSSNHDKNNIVQ